MSRYKKFSFGWLFEKKGTNCIEGCSTGARMQHYEFRVQTAKMKWVNLGCNAGATWVQSGFKTGAK